MIQDKEGIIRDIMSSPIEAGEIVNQLENAIADREAFEDQVRKWHEKYMILKEALELIAEDEYTDHYYTATKALETVKNVK